MKSSGEAPQFQASPNGEQGGGNMGLMASMIRQYIASKQGEPGGGGKSASDGPTNSGGKSQGGPDAYQVNVPQHLQQQRQAQGVTMPHHYSGQSQQQIMQALMLKNQADIAARQAAAAAAAQPKPPMAAPVYSGQPYPDGGPGNEGPGASSSGGTDGVGDAAAAGVGGGGW